MPHFNILKYFGFAHLPEHLQVVSKPFHDLAFAMSDRCSSDDLDRVETAEGLRKLLEAKDCAVRAMIK